MQRYAMLFGTYLGAFWILTSIFFPLALKMPFFIFIFISFTICSPFLAYRYTRIYRDKACENAITFPQAWLFTVLLYMFAAILTAAAHYIYFRFIDNGFIINTYEARIDEVFAQSTLPDMEVYKTQIKEAIDTLRALSPIELTIQLMSNNIFWGAILAIPIALFAMKKKTAVNSMQ